MEIVACDPSTLARDLALLLAGGYVIERMTLVDLFPQTFHLETVVRPGVEREVTRGDRSPRFLLISQRDHGVDFRWPPRRK